MSAAGASRSRLVVAFDPLAPGRAVVQWALRLAADTATTVHALYVEDPDLLTLGTYPWAREVATATARAGPLRADTLERGYRHRAAEARALLESMVPGALEARFEHVRGRLEDELRRTAIEAAAVLVDWPAARRRSRRSAEVVVRALVELSAPVVVLAAPLVSTTRVLVVACSGSAAIPAQQLAERLAPTVSQGVVLMRRPSGSDDDWLMDLALEWSGSLVLVRGAGPRAASPARRPASPSGARPPAPSARSD